MLATGLEFGKYPWVAHSGYSAENVDNGKTKLMGMDTFLTGVSWKGCSCVSSRPSNARRPGKKCNKGAIINFWINTFGAKTVSGLFVYVTR